MESGSMDFDRTNNRGIENSGHQGIASGKGDRLRSPQGAGACPLFRGRGGCRWTRKAIGGVAILASLAAVGCQGPGQGPAFNEQDQFGRTYYVDGAGDWGYGAKIPDGLERAGYRGRVVRFRWSPFLNPALDQTVGRPAARAKGKELADQITAYLAAFPDNEVNIIALSAGTGVATWACEHLKAPAKVNNLVLLGSSLSAGYDMRPALRNVAGGVWVYHSGRDSVLQGPVRVLGTIDGEVGVDSAGLVGLRSASASSSKIRNVAWSPRYESAGWTGGHTDTATETFAYRVLAKHVIPARTVAVAGRLDNRTDSRLLRGV